MPSNRAQVVICGAGIAGISAAYQLAVVHGLDDVLLVDERPPLSLTSDKSTECYRNWWPGPGDAMVSLMNRSIDILEQVANKTGNLINLTRRGYLFASADPSRIDTFKRAGEEAQELGAGPLRMHAGRLGESTYLPSPAEGYQDLPTGSDLITDPTLIREHFPYLSPHTKSVIHARRAGWFSAQQLGMYWLRQAQEHGLRLVHARVEGVEVDQGGVQAVRLGAGQGPSRVSAGSLVVCAGPFLKEVCQMIGVELPVFSELHCKIAINDPLAALPRNAPLVIWTDPQHLPWSNEERKLLLEDPDLAWLLESFPDGVHARPEGPLDSQSILILWTYDTDQVEPVVPLVFDDVHYPEVALRGLSTAIPGFRDYVGRSPRPIIDGGYYTRTVENRPLIGPLPVRGAYVFGALSGFGLMASPAGGELLAAHLTESPLPEYAHWFSIERYQDPDYQSLLEDWTSSGQL